jgi:hypothetical protein
MRWKPSDPEGNGDSGNTTLTFELDAFSWSAPDELDLAGRFTGLDPADDHTPALVVYGGGETHRLMALHEDTMWPPGDGEPWRASFSWDQPPTPVDAAELEIGELVVGLPEPGAVTPDASTLSLVEELTAADDDAEPDDAEPDDAELVEATATELVARPHDELAQEPTDRLREQADLVVAREELRETRAAHAGSLEDAKRVTAQLEDERRGRAADAVRFREAIDALRQTAEETIAAEREELEDLRAHFQAMARREDDTRAQLDAADREVAELRSVHTRVRELLESIRETDGGA